MFNKLKSNHLERALEKEFKAKQILRLVKRDFQLDYFGQHGIIHWSNVLRNCNRIASHYNISSSFFELFALIHDSQRDDEIEDYAHGPNAAKFCEILKDKGLLNLSKELYQTLEFTCYHHSSLRPGQTDNILVKICIDADRLDLIRYGLRIKEELLFTDYAKDLANKINMER